MTQLTNSNYLKLSDFGRVRYVKKHKLRVVKKFHSQICRALELVIAEALPDGKKNLLICIPPRHGKTDIVSKDFPAYCLGHLPDSKFILTSHGARLSIRNSSQVRDIMQSEWYKNMFPYTRIKGKSKDAGAMDFFETTAGGHVYATGVGATGQGAGQLREGFGGALIIDDPMKREDARSPIIRSNVINWYREAAKQLLNSKRTPIIMIMQRLHPDDLAGYVLKEERDDWYVINIPAVDEETGQVLWPERKSSTDLLKLKKVDPFTYYTQFQQSPIIPGGAIFKEEDWKNYDDLLQVEKKLTGKFITADTAHKTQDWNSYSVFQCWGVESTRNIYLLDQIRGRWEFPQLLKNAKDFWDKHCPPIQNRFQKNARTIFIEDKASGQSLIQTFVQQKLPCKPWKASDYIISEDKVSRARECSFMIFGGAVYLPNRRIAPWIEDFVVECNNFSEDGGHSFDDQVDAMTSALLIWKKHGGGLHLKVA